MTDPIKMSADDLKRFAADTGIVEQDNAPTEKRICLGILAHDAKIYSRTHACLMQALVDCSKQGWGFTFIQRDCDSMVARGRSFIASQFLTNEMCRSCTDLVFVDTDLAWGGDEFIRLCSHPVDVVGGAYPFKDDSGKMPLRWPPDGLREDSTTGLWQVQATTPGFFRVTRKALEKIASEMPWLEFKDNGNGADQRSWMFFDNLQRPTGVYDEGYVFCERWRQVGGQVWLDPDLNLTHIGLKAYNHGTIRGWLDKQAAEFERLESEYPGVPPLKLMKAVMGEKIDLEAEKASAA